jgi:hypothetical protein
MIMLVDAAVWGLLPFPPMYLENATGDVRPGAHRMWSHLDHWTVALRGPAESEDRRSLGSLDFTAVTTGDAELHRSSE